MDKLQVHEIIDSFFTQYELPAYAVSIYFLNTPVISTSDYD